MNCGRLYRIGFVWAALVASGASGILQAGNITLDPAQCYVQLEGLQVGAAPGQYLDGTSVANLYTQPDPSVFVSTNGGNSLIELTYYFDADYFLSDLPVEVIINAPQASFRERSTPVAGRAMGNDFPDHRDRVRFKLQRLRLPIQQSGLLEGRRRHQYLS